MDIEENKYIYPERTENLRKLVDATKNKNEKIKAFWTCKKTRRTGEYPHGRRHPSKEKRTEKMNSRCP
uniref:Uncharacterized protein n=1 Tax=Arion vulgaris TaxID=1028688 RepID=A0A0B7BG55_9EUPU